MRALKHCPEPLLLMTSAKGAMLYVGDLHMQAEYFLEGKEGKARYERHFGLQGLPAALKSC